MSKISIKTDFADGEKLFAQELNNNFLVIQSGINANEENLQGVIDQAIIELDKQLEEITADRGWDWNGGNRVTFYKGNTKAIEDKEIINGQLLYNTETGETALDDNGERINTGSGNVVVVSDIQPTNEATKDWIKPIIINGTETAEEYFKNSNNQWKKILNQPSGDTLPIGSISQFGGETAPTNWLFCNGQAVSRETYAELFSVIGTTYGDGDGSTTFNVPDFIGRVPVGLDEGDTDFDTLGETGGEKEHTLTIDEIPSHNHILSRYYTTSTSHKHQGVGGVSDGPSSSTQNTYTSNSTGGDQPHNNMQPYTVTNFIIKAKQSIGLVGAITDNINDVNNNAVPNAKTVKNYVKEAYSTNEIKTNKIWIDGKPIYRKVIDLGNLLNATVKTVNHFANVETPINIYGTVKNNTTNSSFSVPKNDITIWFDKTSVFILPTTDRTDYNGKAIIEYTKTTD